MAQRPTRHESQLMRQFKLDLPSVVVLEAVRARPGTLSEALGRPPRVAEANAAARLLRDGWVTRDMAGRYAVSAEPRTVRTDLLGDAGHGVEARILPLDGRARGKKRKGES